MPVTKDMLVSELQNLLRLTASEQTIATLRRTQARTTALESELAANVQKARERAALLTTAIRQVGGVPDVVGSVIGRVGAFATTQLNQVQSLQGALLGDLTLEHQLRERTRYARTLAQSLDEQQVLAVLDRLETAHSATIDWLEERLAEVGRTGTSLLRATPLQAVVGTARAYAAAPLAALVGTVNQVSARLWHKAPGQVQDALSAAVAAADTALDKGVHVARAATQRTEEVAEAVVERVEDSVAEVKESVAEVAETVDTTVADLAEEAKDHAAELAQQGPEVVDLAGTGEVAHPFAGYERLSGDRIMSHVRDTDDVAELQQLLAFEASHKARKGVLAAAEERLASLSASV